MVFFPSLDASGFFVVIHAFPSKLWHAGRADIVQPTVAGRSVGNNHENSGLGLYCATVPARYITGFGETVFGLTIKSNPRVLSLSIRELAEMGQGRDGCPRSREWFEAQGRRWSEDFDVVALVESSGAITQAIVLLDDAIVGCEKFAAKDYLERIATVDFFEFTVKQNRSVRFDRLGFVVK